MSLLSVRRSAGPATGLALSSRAGVVADLQGRIQKMQSSGLDSQPLPTLPAIAALLPGGTLRAGVTYAVGSQLSIALAMIAGVSAEGEWCGVLGVPGFGVEAAQRAGVDLGRLVLVPDPGKHWIEGVAALADAVKVLIVGAVPRLGGAERSRLEARLRQRGSTMIVLGSWPGVEAEFRAHGVRWEGVGPGRGELAGRVIGVSVRDRRGRSRVGELVCGGVEGGVGVAATSFGRTAAIAARG